jgi:wyosine [tRNA(Phe)-imidazoG37] synthetase (radical SAM superfamily)
LNDIRKVTEKSAADYITFVGDGEPTLCKDLGWLIHKSKKEFSLPIAVITNGSLFYREDIRNDLQESDVVLPSLDAGTQEIFKKINRAHKEITFHKMLQGLIDFRKEYSSNIWLETMLVKGLNDNSTTLKEIKKAIGLINPDRIYVAAPIRPPAEKWVKPPPPEAILVAQQILGKVEYITEREIGDFGIDEFKDACEAIIEISSRHPLRKEQAITIEKHFAQRGTLQRMIEESEVVEYEYQNSTYILPKKLLRSSK